LSITLSGDVDTLEALRAIGDEHGLVARRLKVDVAYHPAHLYACSTGYSADIVHLDGRPAALDDEGQQRQPPIMLSSVTRGEVDPELLGGFYWVRNLISPVLSSDAVWELFSSDGGVDSASNDDDLLIKISPYSALRGPVEQILSHHGMKNVRYMSMITLGDSTLDTSLSLAAEVFRHSIPMDTLKVNGDSPCYLLTDLPPYSWNHY
jgi:zearalenone synthase (highly reducing iterative type I polyketide synthase)